MDDRSLETDVVVAGSGMAGLVSAVRALESGADVIVLEKAPRPGGKTRWSDGAILVDEDAQPQIDVYEPLSKGIDWLESHGVTVKELMHEYSGTGKQIDPVDFIEHMVGVIEEQGGELRLETPLSSLRMGDDNSIAGVVAEGPDARFEIEARSVILATGGYGGNERLIEQYITDNADKFVLRSDPWSTGGGFLAAQDVGAKTTTGLSKFDGHSMLAPPASYTPDEYMEATQYYGPKAIAVDRRGRRFTDESAGDLEGPLIRDMLKRAEGEAFYILDHRLYDESFVSGNVGAMVERARELGGTVLEAPTLDQLGDQLSDQGVNGKKAIETVEAFNAAVEKPGEEPLDPPRERFRDPIDSAPFYAVEVRPGITYTMGGLDVNVNAEVLCRTTSCTALSEQATLDPKDVFYNPIPGLYATGIDVGNPNEQYYIGRLSQALASGRIAGKHAADRATAEQR
ncbi:FAD-dependent oxidoreductase [Haloarchaeobius sp. TZWWS8]|uniref:FAD-dependent oxidoreductase n=1 Tax=Haloarchaeobius sp. TZWWS8 TaxID=3446121 RepID=UPI003EBBFB80